MFKKNILFLLFFYFINFNVLAETNIDQWQDSDQTYKDLINQGFEVKAYDTSTIKTANGLVLMFFVTVLQKGKQVFECQEYQTMDESLSTLDLSFICRELVQPYDIGVGT